MVDFLEMSVEEVDEMIESMGDEQLDGLLEGMLSSEYAVRLAFEVSYTEFAKFISSKGLDEEFVGSLPGNRAFALLMAAEVIARKERENDDG